MSERTPQWHIQNFEKSGMSLEDYTTQMIKDYKEKDQFKAMQAYQMRQFAPPAEKAMEY